jgi:D-3-phosphoglycerate dehydrogenase
MRPAITSEIPMAGPNNEFAPRLWDGRFQKALVLENPDPILDTELKALGIHVERLAHTPDEDELVQILKRGNHNLIYKRSRVEITERVAAASNSLAAVMLCCIGDDSVDKIACANHGVLVLNDPVSNGRSVAEMVIGELIILSRRIFDSVYQMQGSEWQKNNSQRYEVMGKRLGILGLGKIGRQVAQLAEAMGMEILFYDTGTVAQEVGEAMGWKSVESTEELFRASDFVTVHVSATDAKGNLNENLITASALAAMGTRTSSPRIFLNLARGLVVSPDVLKAAIKAGHINYAITDVFPNEPGSSGAEWTNPYEGESRIFATPHIGAATQEAQPRIGRYMARTTQLFSEMGMLRNCVFKSRATIQFSEPDARSLLAVVHVDQRGTKKAVDDAIYQAGSNNLRSAHIDFPKVGIAYDLSALDRPLTDEQCAELVNQANSITGTKNAIRWMRQIPVINGV